MPRVIIFHGSHFMDFYQRQNEKTKDKILYVLDLIKQVDRVPEKFLKSISGAKGLFEIRVEYHSDIHRIFCCFDKGMLVVLLNGFTKKSQKTPKEELAKAEKLMKEYFGSKN
jgi:phage-related protein